MRHLIAKEIKSEPHVWWFLYIKDFFFIIFYGLFGWLLSKFVASCLLFWFGLFHVGMTFFLTLPSLFNVRRKNWQSFAILLTLDKTIYQPIFYEDRERL